MSDNTVDAEFIEALPVGHKCHCPACRTLITEGNFCDWCAHACVPRLRESHAQQGRVRAEAQAKPRASDGREVVEGIKVGLRVADTLAALVSGRRRRR